jgi:hypothetical protein
MSIADVNTARSGQDGTVASPDGPRASRPKRRTFTREYKMRILEQYEDAASPQERNALLRREGIYTAYRLPQARRVPVGRRPRGSVTDAGGVLLDRAHLEWAFTAPGERLAARGVVADIFIVGGDSLNGFTGALQRLVRPASAR